MLSAMLSVEDIAKAPQARMSLTGGPQKRHKDAPVQWSMPGGAVWQMARGLQGTASSLHIGWGIITGATQMTIQCTCWSLIGGCSFRKVVSYIS